MISLLHFMSRQVQDTCPWHSAQIQIYPMGLLLWLLLLLVGTQELCWLTHRISISLLSWDSFCDHQWLLILSFLPFLEQDGFHLHTTDRATRLLPPHCSNAPSTEAHRNKTLQWKEQARDETWWPHIQRSQVVIVMVTLWQEETKSLGDLSPTCFHNQKDSD